MKDPTGSRAVPFLRAAIPGTVLRKKLPAGNVLLALALCAVLA